MAEKEPALIYSLPGPFHSFLRLYCTACARDCKRWRGYVLQSPREMAILDGVKPQVPPGAHLPLQEAARWYDVNPASSPSP